MKKNILVVDDSALMRRVICDIINSDGTFQVVDICRDGMEAYEKLKATQYDCVILDVNMPRMGGLELLEKLQRDKINTAVIMISDETTKDAEVTMSAIERGALDFVTKPSNLIEAKGAEFRERVLSVLSAVLKTERSEKESQRTVATVKKSAKRVTTRQKNHGNMGGNKLIALACSTGGPKALQSVIPFLPKRINAPVVLVQHMPAGFTKSMAERLDEVSQVAVKEAEEGDILQKGHVYIAPGGKHMEIKKCPDGKHKVKLNDMPPIGGLKPCANVTYDSLRDCGYDEIVCVVLTGMGADGTKGICSLVQKKPVYVISQDEESCVVYGMPKAIAETGLVNEVVPLNEVAQTITKNVGVQ